MKIEIDTDNKTIEIKSPIALEMFFDELRAIVPFETWKDYKILTSPVLVVKEYPYIPYNHRDNIPYHYPIITC
jgi:hypothetical protein